LERKKGRGDLGTTYWWSPLKILTIVFYLASTTSFIADCGGIAVTGAKMGGKVHLESPDFGYGQQQPGSSYPYGDHEKGAAGTEYPFRPGGRSCGKCQTSAQERICAQWAYLGKEKKKKTGS